MSTYPLERSASEMARLRLQAGALAADADVLLERIGVGLGWRCLDLGCGVGGITDLMSRRAGATSAVIGLDADPDKLAAARHWAEAAGLVNVDFVEGDVFALDLPEDHFDLTHVRFLFTTIGRADELMGAALRVTRPGGVVAVQEADAVTLSAYPADDASRRLVEVLIWVFRDIGGDPYAGRAMFTRLRGAGLEDVRYRPFVVGATHDQPMTAYLPETMCSVRGAIVDGGLMSADELDAALAACEAHLADPGTITTSVMVCQVWGRKPGTAGNQGATMGHRQKAATP